MVALSVSVAVTFFVATSAAGCGDYGAVTLADQDDGGGGDLRARGVGEACDERVRCRPGLACAGAFVLLQ